MLLSQKYKLILGSKSPRRQELIQQISSTIEIRVQDVDEVYSDEIAIQKVPEYLAQLKANALFSTLKHDEIIICADTVVILENEILGKPENLQDAKNILQKLSGKKHLVITGCCLKSLEKELVFSETTEVYFKDLTHLEIDYYVNKFKPLDKAGSYGIQEWIGMIGIKKINGCFYNAMGLPLSSLFEKLKLFMI